MSDVVTQIAGLPVEVEIFDRIEFCSEPNCLLETFRWLRDRSYDIVNIVPERPGQVRVYARRPHIDGRDWNQVSGFFG